MSHTYSKDESRQKIGDLVEAFKSVEGTLGDSQELQVEEDYIHPLFSYLNWPVQSPGVADSQKEVLLVKTDRRGKRPDCTFQLNGQQLFFVDAKKVKYDMHDPRWLWQVYRYGYSTQNYQRRKVDFAVLTDFKEFVLVDCTLLAETPEAVLNFRVPAFDWKYTDYVAHFDQLWDVFERNNMLAASRDRNSGMWSYKLTPKQAKANRIKPDVGFLNKLDGDKDGWRIRLAKDMKKCNPRLTGDVITGAVQLLIDRLVFIKALSDRDIDEDFLAKLAEIIDVDGLSEHNRGWFASAQPLFDRLNRFYNGSMFAPRPELRAVVTSNRVIREIIRELDPEHSPYDLAVLPVAILGTIYERFLGKVVRTTDQRVKIEKKPEFIKASGIVYTPQYIAAYLVKQTVGKLLAPCKTPAEVAKLKILDPASGSGSILLEAYDAIIEWHKNYYCAKAKPDREAAYRDADGEVRLTAKLKKQILINNIFGVDIDQQAVEVTRFSLSLKALEDTRKEELDEERTLFKEAVLPDLSNNIVCGNSLIGTDIFDGQLVVDEDERKKINPMDYEKKFSAIYPVGFDAVIANPPYIRIQRVSHREIDYLFRRYETPTSKIDLSLLFMERSLKFVHQSGRIGMICTSQWLSTNYGKKLRRLLSSGILQEIVDFGSLPVFAGVNTYPAIFVLSPNSLLKYPLKHLNITRAGLSNNHVHCEKEGCPI